MKLVTEVNNLEGILLIDKPTGCTSHDVVDRVRRKLRMKQIGHAGTLDPLATGLLIILVGKATKASQSLMSLNKEYEGTILLGTSTDSHDAEGLVIQTREVPELKEEDILREMKKFMGDQYQIPPMFSAKKVDGVPLYKLARKGEEIEREPRFINISKFSLLSTALPSIEFCVACSKGTYIRKIAHDLGENLGCGAHLTSLRRTHTERFSVEDAVTLDQLEEMSLAEIRAVLIPTYKAVPSQMVR